MVCFPNAKINLGLNILEKREDGFHNIETVFYPIPLSDILEIIPSTKPIGAEMKISGLHVPGELGDNLCMKAYQMLYEKYLIPPVKIILHKLIPMGAGLGGGSSDGAFTLITLNQLFHLGLTNEQLIEYASKLGSDCAFFIKNIPSIGKGRGNVLSELNISLHGLFMVLIKPDIHIGTKQAYAGTKPFVPSFTSGDIVKLPVNDWKEKLFNDFEKNIFPDHPEIKQLKDNFYKNNAIYASMTGSGAAVFGLFKDEINLNPNLGNYFYWSGWL